MDDFWQQDRLILSIELFAGIIFLALAVYVGRIVGKRLQQNGSSSLQFRSVSLYAFRLGRWALAAAGAATLLATVAPGTLPFMSSVDQNLGLGGIAIFFLWPFIIAQIVFGVLPTTEKMLRKEPALAWVVLVGAYVVFIGVDRATVDLLYN